MDAPPPEPAPRADWAGHLATAAGALGLATLVLALVLGRRMHAPPALLAVVVFFLPHLFMALALALAGCWLARPRRFELLGLLTLTLGSIAAIWGPGWVGRSEPGQGAEVRVLSWNVHRLWGGPRDGGDAEACVAEALERSGADVLALTEVSTDDVLALSARLGLHCVQVDYLGTGASTKGGLAACVRRDSPWQLKSTRVLRFAGKEPWYYVFAEVQQGWRVFNLLTVHLQPYSVSSRTFRRGLGGSPRALVQVQRTSEATFRAQGDQTRALVERVSRFRDPTVLAGDFNSTRDTALHTDLRRHLVDAWERGGHGFGGTVRFLGLVPLRVDHVYASPSFEVRGAEVIDAGCSDHQPLLTTLAID